MEFNRAGRLILLFGGVTPLANAIDVDKAVVSRWDSTGRRGKHGRVPVEYNARILEAARSRGLDLVAVNECLDLSVCPCCQQRLEPGQPLHV